MSQAIPMKQWLVQESERYHIAPISVYYRLKNGLYPDTQIIHRNQRVVFVVPGVISIIPVRGEKKNNHREASRRYRAGLPTQYRFTKRMRDSGMLPRAEL